MNLIEQLLSTINETREPEIKELLVLAHSSTELELRRRAGRIEGIDRIGKTIRDGHNGQLDFETIVADALNPLIAKGEPVSVDQIWETKLAILRAMRGC
jgi:hypothetical protein